MMFLLIPHPRTLPPLQGSKLKSPLSYCTFDMDALIFSAKVSGYVSCCVLWSGMAVLDPKFAQESESGLRSRQSPPGKDENCTQSPVNLSHEQ
jgi:hypothetical protein